jgi:Right handed beta helix region
MDGAMRHLTTRAMSVGLTVLALAIVSTARYALSAQKTIVLKPGRDIQAIVAQSPEGTRFTFEPGIYRLQTIYPKSRQEFIGQNGVILNGAMELTNWEKRDRFWRTKKLPPPLPSDDDTCARGRVLCHLREDLFFNGDLYQRVGSLDDLGPRRWYYENRRAYLAEDPTGQSIELGIKPLAIGGDADNVLIKDLVIEKYATLAQEGAIDTSGGRDWVLSDVTARWNHGVGLFFGSGTVVDGGSFSHNGQLGMAGTGNAATIDGAEIAFNNYAGYSAKWEAGGTKFHRSRGLVVRGTCVHHNDGPGLWTDIDNIDVTYEGNKVFSNTGEGIKHEISYTAVIRDNVVAQNGEAQDVWLWGSQILIQNSRNVEVYRNTVEVSEGFGNGISVIHQDRGIGAHGLRDAIKNRIFDNVIIHLGQQGQNGIVRDTNDTWFWKRADNQFDWNTYITTDTNGEYWAVEDQDGRWNDFRKRGYEQNGELIVERHMPMQLSCGG